MKWCFVATHIPSIREFLGKLANQVVKEGDECLILADSKIGEYTMLEYFPKGAKLISKVDWAVSDCQPKQGDFGDLSWKEFFSDYVRFEHLFNFHDAFEMMSQAYHFIDHVFRTEKPDVIIYEPPSSDFSEIAYYLAKKYKINYLGLIASRFDGKIDVYDLEYTSSLYQKTFKEISTITPEEKNFADDFIEKFVSHKKLPAYMKYQKPSNPFWWTLKNYIRNSVKTLPAWVKYIKKRNHFKRFDFISEIQLAYRIKYPLKILGIRIKKILQSNIFSHLDENDDFFLFPLHIQPESSTSVCATYFYDQVSTIRNIAFSLPFPYKLYVKEHPAVRGDRPKDFYKKIKQIPNVVLISPFEKTEKLIEKSKGVITLTSTIGMEAALAGKQAYILGNVFYSFHPFCKKIASFESLKEAIKNDIKQTAVVDNVREINRRFIISYFKNTTTGEIGAVASNDKNDYKIIYQDIKRLFLENDKS